MPDSPPRLDTAPSSQPGYAPVSWTAVASLGVAGVFVLVLLVMAIDAYRVKQPLITPAILILPALAVVLAFTARRQIQNSEGTRTGEPLAAAGWWVSVIVGVIYVAYLFGLDFAIRNDAEREFVAWAKIVTEIDPANPRDPKLYEAVLKTVPSRSRSQVKGPQDTETMDKVFREELTRLRQLDIVRIAGRNKGKVEFAGFGVKDWQQTPSKTVCTLSCRMLTPEGEHTLVIPMQADQDKGGRQWQVGIAGEGFAQSESLTKYGWIIKQLEGSGKQFAGGFLTTIHIPEQHWLAYQYFVRPEEDARTMVGAAVAGLVPVVGRDQVAYQHLLDGPLFSLPDGSAPSPDDRLRFRQCWEQGRIRPPGATLRDSPDVNPVLRLTESAVELRVPIELNLAGGALPTLETARGKLVLRAVDPALVAEINTAREQKGGFSTNPPSELLTKPVPWRVVRIESDLKPVPVAPPPAEGQGGPPGGMFGG